MNPSLFASSERQAKRKRLNDPLSLLSQSVDFASIARSLDAHLQLGTSAKGEWPAWPTEVMVRLLLLQQLYSICHYVPIIMTGIYPS